MGSSYLTNPIVFLLSTALDLYIVAVILRFLLQWIRADFYNPISQFLVKATNPPLIPLRRILPGLGGIDLAALILILILAIIELFLIFLLKGVTPTPIFLIAQAIAKIIELFLSLYFFTILIQVALSWINPNTYNPTSMLLHQLNEPLLRPLRRLLPQMGGFDLSPLIAIVLIQVSKMILLPPIYMLR